jgi:hypothetical protein
MQTVYQIFAEALDGEVYLIRGSPSTSGRTWHESKEDARRAALGASVFGNATRFWLVECAAIEEIKLDDVPKTKATPENQSAEVHITHSFHAEKNVPGEHSTQGEPCADQVDGMLHRRVDTDRMVELLHEMGFQVKLDRVVRTTIIDDPEFVGKDGD